MTNANKPKSSELKELSWFDCQLLELILEGQRFTYGRQILIQGTTAYIFHGDPNSISCYDYIGYLDSVLENLHGFTINTSALTNKLKPYTFMAMHKVLDLIAEWIINNSSGEMLRGFKSKINRLKELREHSVECFPSFFIENPLLQDIYINCYEEFTKFRNQAAHTPHINVDEYGSLSFTFNDGSIKQISSKEITSAFIFTNALIGCLTEEDLLRLEIAKRTAYLSAKDLLNYHHIGIPQLFAPCCWSQVQYGFNKTPDDIQELESIEINLDVIKQAILLRRQPEENEEVRFDISVHLEDPYSQPNYVIPPDVIERGGIITIGRKDLVLHDN